MTDKYEDMDPVALLEEVRKLDARINNPITANFIESMKNEAVHQIGRWGSVHDRGKTPLDWFWLIGFLAQKAPHAALDGNTGKALHQTISTAAVLMTWQAQILQSMGEDCLAAQTDGSGE